MPTRYLLAGIRSEYRRDLADPAAYLATQGISRIQAAQIQGFVTYRTEMDRRVYRDSARNRKTYTIKAFFNFRPQ